jgi:hypothetical protein
VNPGGVAPAPTRARTRLAALLVAALPATALPSFVLAPEGPANVVAAFAGEPAPLEAAPLHLSETGLYRADGTVDPRNRPFTPQYPLWTDGAEKSRWVRLPDGARIDVSDLDAWSLPPGTTFWKEFAWNGRKVETRMIRRTPGGSWLFATYVWNEEQTDARLAPEEGVPAAFEIAPGKRHSIPGVTDCTSCHLSAPGVVLGFNALQLSDDRDPLAPHAERPHPGALTLRALVAEDRLAPPRPELAIASPRIRSRDPVERAALGYLSTNCGTCHNDRGPLARLGFSLRHDAGGAPRSPEPGRATTAGTRGRYVIPGVDADSTRLVSPGAPERSALLHRMRSRRAASQMPPLGTTLADEEAIALVGRWIRSL